jgi:GxxExxY protein
MPASRINLLVDQAKAVAALARLHQAQLLADLRLSGCKLGLLVNFSVVLLKQTIKRKSL